MLRTMPIPDHLRALLERPLFAALGTIRPDDTVQVNPMWFEYDGEHVRFTHTNKRGKFRNLQRNPSMSLMVIDPDNPQSYLELRGRLLETIDDPAGEFYVRLGRRYGNPDQQPPPDKAFDVRVDDHVADAERPHGRGRAAELRVPLAPLGRGRRDHDPPESHPGVGGRAHRAVLGGGVDGRPGALGGGQVLSRPAGDGELRVLGA